MTGPVSDSLPASAMAAVPCDPLRLDTETMTMDENTFARYAEHLEREDFESDLYRICCSIRWDE